MPLKPSLHRVWKKLRLRLRLATSVLRSFDDDLDRCAAKVSYSQCGEDVIVWFLLHQMRIRRPGYIDVGAHHPKRLSNTALLYAMGARGINIEPDPTLFAAFPVARPDDLNLNIGVGSVKGTSTFYRMADPSLNTFSEEEAKRMETECGMRIMERKQLPCEPLAGIVARAGRPVDFVSIDVEGHDLAVLATLDFDACRPAVLCIETVDFVSGRKNFEIARWLAEKNYGTYADTRINTVFVDLARLPLP
jgi:FkbM family methyltransferase